MKKARGNGETRELIYQHLVRHGECSISSIVPHLGISFCAVAAQVRNLIEEGRVHESRTEWTVSGRGSPRRYFMAIESADESDDAVEPRHPHASLVLHFIKSGIGKRAEIVTRTGLAPGAVSLILARLKSRRDIVWSAGERRWKPGASAKNRLLSMIGLPPSDRVDTGACPSRTINRLDISG